MKKIKILFAINHLGVGGAENMMTEQAGAIDPERFDPYIFSVYKNPPNNVLSKMRIPKGHYFEASFKSIFDIASWWRLYSLMRKEKFDCVLTNLFDANLIVRTAAILTGVPCILSYEHNIYKDKHRWQIIADRILAKWNTKVLVGAPQVRDFTLAQQHLPSDKVVVVLDGADLVFGQVKAGRGAVLKKMSLPEDYLYVVAAGRFVEQKGHTYLIEAWKQVVEHYKGTQGEQPKKIKLIIFGDGVLRESLEKQVKEGRLDNDILMPGIAPMADIMAISDIFSLISLWEGFSIALIQAMNACCPIVASRVSGTVDAVVPGVEGLLVDPKDSKAAAEAFIRLIDDPMLRTTLGANANKKSELYHVKNRVKEIEQIVMSKLYPR